MKAADILGINSRNQLFSYPYNSAKGKKIAASKLLTKKYLKAAGVPIPEIFAKFKTLKKFGILIGIVCRPVSS